MWELNPNSSWWIHRCGLLAGGCGISRRNCNSWWNHRCWTVSWWLWHHVGVESPTAAGGFTGAGLLAGGCGIVVPCGSWIPNNSWWIHRCKIVSWWLWHHVGVNPNSSWWIHRCWTVSWWLWHRVGVESPAAVGGFTGAGLLAGGCGIVVSCGSWIPNSSWWVHRCKTVSWWLWHHVGVDLSSSWWIRRCWTVSWWLWHQQSELQQLVDSQVLDC